MNLEGKVALISGGGTGIGRGVALALGKAGCKVAICGRRQGPLELVVQEITTVGGVALPFQTDISKENEISDLVKLTEETFGSVDILVNNAGIGGGGRIASHNIQTWDRIMQINLRGAFLLTRAVLPTMQQQKSGHIVNISSEGGLEYYQGSGAYGVSKHAMNALSEYTQRENQDYGIRVDTICPGMVVTEMTENTSGLDHEKCLYPEDIADLVLWLLSRRSNIKIGTPILIQTMLNPWK